MGIIADEALDEQDVVEEYGSPKTNGRVDPGRVDGSVDVEGHMIRGGGHAHVFAWYVSRHGDIVAPENDQPAAKMVDGEYVVDVWIAGCLNGGRVM